MGIQAAEYRVRCAASTSKTFRSLDAAVQKLNGIEELGACQLTHDVEVYDQVTDSWFLSGAWLATRILTVDLGDAETGHRTRVRTFDGELTLVSRGWTADTAMQAAQEYQEGTPEWRAFLGRPERALLTEDGEDVDHRWCRCGGDYDDAIRYERWAGGGRTAHGYACPSCRGIVQTG